MQDKETYNDRFFLLDFWFYELYIVNFILDLP